MDSSEGGSDRPAGDPGRTTSSPPEPISVVIGTRDRGDQVVAAIRSILANDYPHFDICVVDQSRSRETEIALEPFLRDPRIRYLRSSTIGVSSGRNAGIAQAKNDLIAITDDDCEAAPAWLWAMDRAFKVHARIGIVFGNVVAAAFREGTGFIPTYERTEPFLARTVWEKNRVRGIGACMGLRRSAWAAVDGFDQMLGPGAPLKCHEEADLTIRLLMAGYFVYETPEVSVVHHGFRTWKQGRALAVRNYYGIGATLAKYVKLRRSFIVPVIGRELGAEVLGHFFHNIFYERRLTGATPVWAFGRGFVAGLCHPVDRDTRLYRETTCPST